MTRILPIQQHIPDILTALETSRRAVVQAPPGAGKTTRVPLALLDAPWLTNKKIILLEPRRLAAISCATHMADLLKEKVGQTIGYQIRLDRKIGPNTRIEVITEGIFTRKIQTDPSLELTFRTPLNTYLVNFLDHFMAQQNFQEKHPELLSIHAAPVLKGGQAVCSCYFLQQEQKQIL